MPNKTNNKTTNNKTYEPTDPTLYAEPDKPIWSDGMIVWVTYEEWLAIKEQEQ